jgi:hypothetical protein
MGLSCFILVGIIIIILVTMIPLYKQGKTWMTKSAAEIDDKQSQFMSAISFSKSIYVEVVNYMILFNLIHLFVVSVLLSANVAGLVG